MTVGNRTLYSTAKQLKANTHCQLTTTAGPDQINYISELGVFETKAGCYVKIGDMTILPSNLEAMSLDDTPELIEITPTVIQHLDANFEVIPLQEAPRRIDTTSLKMVKAEYTPKDESLHERIQQHSGYIGISVISVFTIAAAFLLVYCCCRWGQSTRRAVEQGSEHIVRFHNARSSRNERRTRQASGDHYGSRASVFFNNVYDHIPGLPRRSATERAEELRATASAPFARGREDVAQAKEELYVSTEGDSRYYDPRNEVAAAKNGPGTAHLDKLLLN